MLFLKKIPSTIYLIFSFLLITTAIAALFLGKFILAVIFLLIGLTALIMWTFFGLFEETKKT